MDLDWLLALGKPLAVGLLGLGVIFALVGYVTTMLVWRMLVILAWRARAQRRKPQP